MSVQLQRKIFRYIFSLLALSIVVPGAFGQQAQNSQVHRRPTSKKAVKKKAEPQPFLRSVTIQGDVAGPLISRLSTTGLSYAEAAVDVNIRNRWFPVWELGHASINHTADEGGQYIASSIYNRIGINVNMLKISDTKQITQSIFYVGVRFGFSSFHYDIHNLMLTDDYWNTSSVTNLDGLKASAKWGELVAGIRVNLFKNISLGWSGRLKMGLHTGNEFYTPWYVPGYGQTGGSVWGFTYTVGYTIPIR